MIETISKLDAMCPNGGGSVAYGLNGGTITGNSAYTNGGGIYIEGTVVMNGGVISDNIVTEEPDSQAYNYGGQFAATAALRLTTVKSKIIAPLT